MDLLKKYEQHFKDIPSLYDYQSEVLAKLCQHKNTLAIVPTGGGKSLIYQLLALDLEGITLVISPLIALMEEQVDELNDKRDICSLALNSNIPLDKQRSILRNLDNSYRLIYISPERLQNSFFRASLIASGVSISMIVVDEAHCISQWGSSFRPDYGQINGFVEFLNSYNHNPFMLCLTATLSRQARTDVALEFKIAPENIVIKDIIRQNLKLHFQKVNSEDEKSEYLRQFLLEYKPKKTIAYLYSKRKCEEYADEFSDDYKTDFYHAGIDSSEKNEVHKSFTKTKIDILFATTAFGMGINIPDIESVVHIQIPNSVEEYYQQVGRGWRKKTTVKDCHCLALWSDVNFDRREKELEGQKYTPELLNEAFNSLLGSAKIKEIGQIVNKDRESLMKSDYNLPLIKYKLEKYNQIKTVGEINGSPLTIEFNKNTQLWSQIVQAAKKGIDSFRYVSKTLNIPVKDIIQHLFEEDLKGNIKKLPAMKKDIYFEVLVLELDELLVSKIVDEINAEVDFRIARLKELKELFTCENKEEMLSQLLS